MNPQAGFQVIPAVDVVGGEAVRLEQGDFERVAVRAGDPEQLVARFAGASPPLVHIVDLDGARRGAIRPRLIERLVRAAGQVPVQASGGIRAVADAERLLAAGAERVVVGTAAFAERDSLERFAALGERLVVAVDARAGHIALAGWQRETRIEAGDAAARCATAGARRLLCTAINRDGTLEGPDLELLARVRDRSGLPVLAAGGIRTTEDLDALASIGLEGAVVGRALLEGMIPLASVAMSATQQRGPGRA
jgi:phosphoribosylformimino-5-aminoimidazole carboxamide ribotide isomerase